MAMSFRWRGPVSAPTCSPPSSNARTLPSVARPCEDHPMTNPLFDLTGRTALITGSSRGLGRAMAEGLAKAGAKVLINGTDPTRVAAAVEEFRAAGHQADAVAFNVTSEADVVRAFDELDSAGVAVDILVNN